MANAVAACAPCSGAVYSSTKLSQQLHLFSSFRIPCGSSRRVSLRCLRTHAARKSDQLSTGRPAPVPAAAAEKKSLIQRVEDPLAQRDYRPPQEGDGQDFWEGSGWDGVGFVLQYLWAFGIAIAILACVYAVRTYNSGASDFTQTETFKSAQEAARPADGPPTASTITDDAPPL